MVIDRLICTSRFPRAAASLQPTSETFGQRLSAATAAYWGDPRFGDTFTRAAIGGSGNFSAWDAAARRELLTKGSAYLVVRQNVLSRLFDGVDSCLAGARTAASHEWQVAWALYTGSLEGTDGTTDGKSMYALGDKRCPQFLTCEGGASSTHPARNNVAAAAEWLRGLAALGAGDCFGALAAADTVVAQATIPLLQGLLREAWEVDPAGVTIAGRPNLWKAERRPAACCAHLPTSAVCFTPHSPPARSNRSNRAHAWQGGGVADGRVEVAEGWAFTAAVLPQLALCNGSAAQLVYDNMFLNADPIVKDGFGLVKTTVEVRM